jgi:uncharacterized membrane protein
MSEHERTVPDTERIVSLVAGASLLAFAATRRRPTGIALATATAGAGLIALGVSGRPIGIAPREQDTRRALGGLRGIHVFETVVINRPVSEVYSFWRDFRNLPRFLTHLQEVTPLNDNISHWIAKGPAGMPVEWDAEIINDVLDKLIAWRSVPVSAVVSAGSVNFRELPGRGTEVRVKLQYEPPAGRLGASIARLLGDDPGRMIREDLRRLKMQLEAGEVPTTEGQPRGVIGPNHRRTA